MSVPGLLAPVDHQGRKLVDGGLVDNLPVAEVRERCQADVVIAVNVGTPLLKAEEDIKSVDEQYHAQFLAGLTKYRAIKL